MVVYKSVIKRRYRDGSSCVESIPKRAKVHAQRKFAQGLNSNNLPEKTFIKEKEKVKPNGNSDPTPLLPADRPKTEDFLTFLCFRGTSVLPRRLDFFNVASSSDNCGSATPSTSNQASAEVTKVKNEKISGKHSAVKIHPNKYKEKSRKGRAVASRMDVKRRSGRLARTEVIRRKQNIRRKNIRPQRVIVRRPLNSAVQRRIADKKMRAGLRSGGTLPAGSDVGLSTFRRPRSDRSSSSQTVSYPVRKSAIPLGDTSADDEEEEEEEDDEEEEEEEVDEDDDEENEKRNVKENSVGTRETKDDKNPRVRTRSSSLKSHPSPAHSLKRMPSRKTKEAATAYMEMISKSLRSPDIETDSFDEEEETQKIDKDVKKNREVSKRQVKPSLKAVPKKTLPGRSLKDKSLKRISMLNSQRKTLARNLKVRRIEELSKRRTRSIAEAEKDLRPRRRSARDKSKTEAEMEVDESENEKNEVEGEEEVKNSKKSNAKKEVHTKQANIIINRRSRRSVKDDVVDSNKKTNTDSTKKQTRSSLKESSVDSTQDSRVSRRNQFKAVTTNKDIKNDLTKEIVAKNSPTRSRGRESVNKKETVPEPIEVDVKGSPGSTQLRRGRNDIKNENNYQGRSRGGNAKKEEEVVPKSSPSGPNPLKIVNKKAPTEDTKRETDSLPAKSGNKKEIIAEVAKEKEEKSPVRSTRKSNLLDKVISEESSKSTPKRKVGNDSNTNNIGMKRRSIVKDKVSVEKDKGKMEDNETDMSINNAEDEICVRSKRNSRSSLAGSQNKELDVKKRNIGKKQNSVDTPEVVNIDTPKNTPKRKVVTDSEKPREEEVLDDNVRPKRSVRKKSEIIIDKDESASEEEAGGKRNNRKPSNLPEETKQKSQIKKKLSASPEVIEESTKGKCDSTVSKPKVVTRKKNSNVSQSDEENAPKKKLRRTNETKNTPVVDVEEKTSAGAKKKNFTKQLNEKLNVDKDSLKKKVNENKNNLLDTDIDSEMNKKSDNSNLIDKVNLNPKPNTNSKDADSREGSLEKLDEKDLKGFDEVNAKEMENKVDKFIEQMILKTSDDECKSKMRSKFKQAGDSVIIKEDPVKTKTVKSNVKGKINKELDKSKPKGQNGVASAPSVENVSPKPFNNSEDMSSNNPESMPESQTTTLENSVRGKRKSKTELKEKGSSNDKNESSEVQKMSESDVKKESSAGKTQFNDVKEEIKNTGVNNESSGKTKKAPEVVNGCSELKGNQDNKGAKVDVNEKLNPDSISRRTSVSSRISTDTTISECKVVLETLDNLPLQIRAQEDVNKQKPPDVKTPDIKKIPEAPRTKTRGMVRAKRTEEQYSKSESSDSEEEPTKRESKIKVIKKKKKSPAEINKPQPRRGLRELKALDTSHITLRTSRARVAKHSSSSFYYETESSSHYSSSEEDVPIKKNDPPASKLEVVTTLTVETKDPPKEPPAKVSEVKTPDVAVEEKKVNDIPEDLIDFKSDFVRNDTLLLDPCLKDNKRLNQAEVLTPEDVRNIVKEFKASTPKITELPSTSTPVAPIEKDVIPEVKKPVIEHKISFENRSMFEEARDSMELLASVAEDVSSKMNSLPVEEIKPPVEKQEVAKSKPKPSSIGETWIQAFKRAKIPKPGQLSPISHSVKPFVRKPFINQPFSKQQSPIKCDPPESNFKPFDRSSIKPQSSLVNSPPKQVGLPFKSSLPSPSTIPLVKPLTSDNVKEVGFKTTVLNIPSPAVSNSEIKKEQTIANILNQQTGSSKSVSPLKIQESFKPVDKVKEEPKCTVGPKMPVAGRSVELGKDKPGGKHQNLPLAVEHTLRKMSPVAVSRKPVASVTLKPQIQVPNQDIKEPNLFDKQSKSNRSSPSSGSKSSWLWKPEKYLADSLVTKPSDLELMAKKKVNMTMEEIEMWLNDSTSAGIEHSKDCGLFEKNQCECSFRTSGSSMQNSVNMLVEERSKVGRSIVEPPMQLKDIEPKCTAETISACKVEDYKEKLISKTTACQFKDIKPEARKDALPKYKHPPTPTKQEKAWKSTRSMTEEEMCDFDFRFERNSNSPRESGSEMSSPTPKDEMSSSNDEGIGSHQSEKKSIFHKKSRPLSKSPCAFNAENESSVYAFEPESDLPVSKPFRRKNRLSGDESSRSTSIAVQVNLEPETVLECSTQTEQEEEDGGATFYIPLRRKSVEPQQMIQGVTVKLDADPVGQEHRVTLRAKLVTKPPTDFPRPPPTSRSLVGRSSGKSGKPEQKVRPLSMTDSKLPVGTVQPTFRPPADQPSTSQDSFPASTSSKSSQSTQFSTTPLKLATDNKATSPLQSNSKLVTDPPESTSEECESGFPKVGMTPRIVEAPAFYPTEKEFLDPLEYLDKITPQAEHYGICRIVPPPSFKPECKVSDDMRFTSYNQYVHKMMRRWGPSVKEMTAIKKYLATQSIALTHPPWIGGMEVDLPRLYQTVQQCGGLKEVIEKKRWTRVADAMKIPKCAQDRVTKLDDIYCKYLLPYDTLSHNERCKLLDQVEHDWEEKERRVLLGESSNNSDESDSDSDDGMIECITKGRSMALSQFYRIARNTLWMWFGSEGGPPVSEDVESEYWNQVTERTNHVCVHSGSIDCGTWGYGFPTAKTSSTSKHPWNLKVLTNHPASVLRSLPPLMGVTVPTLHVGMLFSTFCWYRDPHGLPWIEYLHTGANKIWYGVPDSWTNELRGAIKSVLPSIVRESPVWLPSDTAMLPPQLLLDKGVSLCRTVQEPGQFIVIFPKAYTSAICTGYLVSESVYYAPSSWLATAEMLFKETKESCEPTMFSLEKLLFFIANDTRSPLDILIQVCPMVESVRNREVKERKELRKLGLQSTEKLPKPSKRSNNAQQQEYECNNCRSNLFLSHVNNSNEDANYCLADALDMISKDASQLKHCKLLYLYDEEEMEELIEKIKSRIDIKSQKKNSKINSSVGNSSKT